MTLINRVLLLGSAAAAMISLTFWRYIRRRWFKSLSSAPLIVDGCQELIGSTPMMHLPNLSKQLGAIIQCKCEFMNPGGTPKDRIAKAIIDDAESSGKLKPGGTVYEGTVGSTGIALAWICAARGYKCVICMPDDVAIEKVKILEALGATVKRLRPAPITDRNHFVRVAQDLASGQRSEEGFVPGFFANQFENLANIQAHYNNTAPEIYRQCNGRLDALVLGAGTGGTLAGCARYLKPLLPRLSVILADPQGSGLYNKVRRNVFFSPQEAEGKRSRHQVDTVVEGVGIHRMTGNLEAILGRGKNVLDFHRALNYSHDDPLQLSALAELCWVDDAIRVSDREAAIMSRYLVRHEGLFVGSSSCVNLVAVVKLVRRWRASGLDTSGKVVVTMLCDAGYRHLTKFWSDSYLLENGILSHQDDLQKLTGDLTFIL